MFLSRNLKASSINLSSGLPQQTLLPLSCNTTTFENVCAEAEGELSWLGDSVCAWQAGCPFLYCRNSVLQAKLSVVSHVLIFTPIYCMYLEGISYCKSCFYILPIITNLSGYLSSSMAINDKHCRRNKVFWLK